MGPTAPEVSRSAVLSVTDDGHSNAILRSIDEHITQPVVGDRIADDHQLVASSRHYFAHGVLGGKDPRNPHRERRGDLDAILCPPLLAVAKRKRTQGIEYRNGPPRSEISLGQAKRRPARKRGQRIGSGRGKGIDSTLNCCPPR